MSSPDPFAAKRQEMREEFFAKLYLLGGWTGSTDTYKRTMWAAVPDLALAPACYTLTFRKGLPEPGAADQLVMAGHEAMLAQWFHRPLKRSDIELSRRWYRDHSNTRAFPDELWDAVLAAHPGEDVSLPVDVWGFPGGQTFLAGVPSLAFEGPGGVTSYLEPAMCRYFAPVIQATKGRLMKLATPRDAEFGLRAAPVEVCNLILLLARYVGGGGQLTSNDTAEFLYPELFKSIGTIGHEMMCAAQSFDRPLADAEFEMMDRFVTRMGTASLLCDLVDAETVGLENALRVIRGHPETDRVGIRVDSGDIAGQCVLYFEAMRRLGITPRLIVFEDEVSPDLVRKVYDVFRARTGVEPTMLFPGAGGYWWRLVHRDTVSAAFKRTATGDRPNIKFSNSPGKETIPGYTRVYARGETLIVADASEQLDAEPLYVKLVEQGRIVYHESLQDQAARADRTWGRYKKWEPSPKVGEYLARFRAMKGAEIAAARARVGMMTGDRSR
ncbi:MAG: nicotinate phosphoribosyltransferase [Gemmataceae bacterium]|nr:nicotinate phosphoribosyltransferase [Gemmataceae bacterium]